MTMESLVIGFQHDPVNMSLLPHTPPVKPTEQGFGEARFFELVEPELSEVG